jgi:phenylpropionate dioxygenase-like ring-hydroxylating dioxygenase large terminal subunit
MLVVTFDPTEFNFIKAGDESYFLLRFADGSLVLFNDCCDHRGGPLHLGHWDREKSCLVCPWHESKYSEKVLRKQAQPLIQHYGRVTAILDTDPSTPIRLVKKNILAVTC